jgi:alpha-L-fucosidase
MVSALLAAAAIATTQPQSNPDIDWWREARFGMFIHWGLYAVPAGEWGERKTHGEWIMSSGQIPIPDYEKFADQFNPTEFDANEWAEMAVDAGMKYLVITTKHHDGFCLWPSEQTDWDIERTPYKKDILKQIADACRANGLKIGWYHSIMDWHHPDYLPRRGWEDRPAEGADFNLYRSYLHNQVKEILTNYGKIDVIWFDGEWEATWIAPHGRELFNEVVGLQPQILVNNRVGAGRSGGHFGTPEQRIPETGLPGEDWETCMTMGRTWGYNKSDENWKSTQTLIRNLCDIASKGGNYLLNVGPMANGLFPDLAVERLEEIGDWMDTNGEAIHGTTASPVGKPEWGRITRKGNDLYLILFEWPKTGFVEIPNLGNGITSAEILGHGPVGFAANRHGPNILLSVPKPRMNENASVIKITLDGAPIVYSAPQFDSFGGQFIGSTRLALSTASDQVEVHYTLDGSAPTAASPKYSAPIPISRTTTIKAASFHRNRRVSETAEIQMAKVPGFAPSTLTAGGIGLLKTTYKGKFDRLPDFGSLTPDDTEVVKLITLPEATPEENVAHVFKGLLQVDSAGIYEFELTSDDGSKLLIDGQVIVDHDGNHSTSAKTGFAPLQAGRHLVEVQHFNSAGGSVIELKQRTKGGTFESISAELFRLIG